MSRQFDRIFGIVLLNNLLQDFGLEEKDSDDIEEYNEYPICPICGERHPTDAIDIALEDVQDVEFEIISTKLKD
jgi:hypothetical protein